MLEIKLLESLIGMDGEGEEFRRLEKELAEKGAAERAKLQEQADRKQSKVQRGRKVGKRKDDTETESGGDENAS